MAGESNSEMITDEVMFIFSNMSFGGEEARGVLQACR